MSRYLVLLAALSLLACDRSREENGPSKPSNIIINNCAGNNCQGSNNPSDPSTPSQCSKVQRVEVKILGDGARSTLAVGEIVTLDATAFDSSTHIDVTCAVSWSATPANICSLSGDLTSYNPTLRANASGTCAALAVVGNGSGARTFVVQ